MPDRATNCTRQICCLAVDHDRVAGRSMVRAQVTAWSERQSQGGAAVFVNIESPGVCAAESIQYSGGHPTASATIRALRDRFLCPAGRVEALLVFRR